MAHKSAREHVAGLLGGSSAAVAAAAHLTTCLIYSSILSPQLPQMILKLQLLKNGMIAVLGRFLPVRHTFVPCFHRLFSIIIDRKQPKALQLQKIPFSQRKCTGFIP